MAFVISTAYRDDILDLYKAQFGTSLRLFKLPTTGEPSRTMAYADFTSADFTGYAAQTTAYQAAILEGDAAYSFSDTELFQRTSGATDNDIYGAIGYYDADELAAAMLASTPQAMEECGDAILLQLKIWLKDTGSAKWMFCNEFMKRIVVAFKPYRCHLFKTDVTPTATSVLGDFAECTFPGYARSTFVCWGDAALDGNTAYTESCLLSWTATGDSDPAQLAYGYYLTGTDSCDYIGAELFASPIDMSDLNDNLAMKVKLNLSNPVT